MRAVVLSFLCAGCLARYHLLKQQQLHGPHPRRKVVCGMRGVLQPSACGMSAGRRRVDPSAAPLDAYAVHDRGAGGRHLRRADARSTAGGLLLAGA
jgi:hypothetical protein